MFKSDISHDYDVKKDGNPCAGNVYVFRITFMINNAVGTKSLRVEAGTLMLARLIGIDRDDNLQYFLLIL